MLYIILYSVIFIQQCILCIFSCIQNLLSSTVIHYSSSFVFLYWSSKLLNQSLSSLLYWDLESFLYFKWCVTSLYITLVCNGVCSRVTCVSFVLILPVSIKSSIRMGNTCIPVADSFWYLAKLIQLCKA